MTIYGNSVKVSVYGGSHDPEIGVHCSGLPEGFKIDIDKLNEFLQRRAPGKNRFSTQRKEADAPVFLSGVDENMVTDGNELHAAIYNSNQRSSDYNNLAYVPRPSHADYAARMKYGENVDLRGGGHFSARLTAPLCIAGGIAKQILESKGIYIGAHIYHIGGVHDTPFDPINIDRETFVSVAGKEFPVINDEMGLEMQKVIDEARMDTDSVGGVVECAVIGLDAGIGEHMFDGMEGRIASMIFSIPAVKGVEFGLGFGVSNLRGSENNDQYYISVSENGEKSVKTKTNNCGGIIGGMTNGMPLVFRGALKPTPSIAKEQDSVDLRTMENTKLVISGRHDPCVVPRAVPVFEAACAIAILNALKDENKL